MQNIYLYLSSPPPLCLSLSRLQDFPLGLCGRSAEAPGARRLPPRPAQLDSHPLANEVDREGDVRRHCRLGC